MEAGCRTGELRENSAYITYQLRLYAMLGENEKATAWLEVAYQKRYRQFFWIKVDRRLKNLHGLPRFEALVKQIGL